MSRRADKIRVEAAAMRKALEDQGMCQADALAQEAGLLMGVIEGLCVQLDDYEQTAAEIQAANERGIDDPDLWRDRQIDEELELKGM